MSNLWIKYQYNKVNLTMMKRTNIMIQKKKQNQTVARVILT